MDLAAGAMDEQGPGENAWTDFGQRIDLCARIREILINYPEGTSILKEMVQVSIRFEARSKSTWCNAAQAEECSQVAPEPQLGWTTAM